MNNEPVAWINRHMNDGWLSWDKDSNADSSTPLYLHPAKTLTDEEILEELLIPKSEWDSYKAHHCLKQIRAILRKAQEK